MTHARTGRLRGEFPSPDARGAGIKSRSRRETGIRTEEKGVLEEGEGMKVNEANDREREWTREITRHKGTEGQSRQQQAGRRGGGHTGDGPSIERDSVSRLVVSSPTLHQICISFSSHSVCLSPLNVSLSMCHSREANSVSLLKQMAQQLVCLLLTVASSDFSEKETEIFFCLRRKN